MLCVCVASRGFDCVFQIELISSAGPTEDVH